MLRLQIDTLATERGFNRNQLQLRSGVTLPLLTRYWNNNSESVTLRELDKIAKALGVKTIELFKEVEEEND